MVPQADSKARRAPSPALCRLNPGCAGQRCVSAPHLRRPPTPHKPPRSQEVVPLPSQVRRQAQRVKHLAKVTRLGSR